MSIPKSITYIVNGKKITIPIKGKDKVFFEEVLVPKHTKP